MKHFRMFSVLAICMLLADLANAQVSGAGSANFIAIWTSTTNLGSSTLYQSGTKVGVGNVAPAYSLDVTGHINASSAYKIAGASVLAMPGGTANGNISVGYLALPTPTGGSNTAIGYAALQVNSSGFSNTAVGTEALSFNTGGFQNTAIGTYTLPFNTTGSNNTATGYLALYNNTGNNNTANGWGTLSSNTTGGFNTAIGIQALYNNTTGEVNTAIGNAALFNNTTGQNNTAIGTGAGFNVSGGNSNNIHIGSAGASTDSGVIRIGTQGTQTSFFAQGIYAVSSGSYSAVPVLVDSSGQLVTVSSSRRFKEDIQDMGDASRDLMRLRPVTFRYKKPLADGSQPIQYGLIAEEVAEVYPDLVSYAADGQIQSVKYQLLEPMLLNEVQRQHAELQELQERLNKMEAALAAVSHAPESR